MDVALSNFEDVFKDIQERLPECNFITIDLELTGIDRSRGSGPEERFKTMKECVTQYNIIQFGLCLFKEVEDTSFFEVRPYNIYVFPRETFRFSPKITLDATTIQYNVKHNMNFQKWICEGVGYVQYNVMLKKREELKGKGQTGQERTKWEEHYNQSFGVTRIIELLIQEKKPIVGHNCYIDLMFLMHSFVEDISTWTLAEFLQKLNEYFPKIYDTKVISSRISTDFLLGRESTLENIRNAIQRDERGVVFSKKGIVYPNEFVKYDIPETTQDEFIHEAGYDALITGFAFVNMFYKLDEEVQRDLENCLYTFPNSFKITKHLSSSTKLYKTDSQVLYNIEKKNSRTEWVMKKSPSLDAIEPPRSKKIHYK